MRYKEEISFLEKVEDKKKAEMNERKKWTDEETTELSLQYPGIPEDYLDYLKEIGTGSFRECQFIVHGALETIEDLTGYDLYDLYDLEDKKFLVFGDNYSGDFSGFLIEDEWKVAEFWHESEELHITGQTFQQYIRNQMLMDESGGDRRIKVTSI
ncbi:SMI1/KNR4 family protein [Clostridium sp. OS1-26]|uniref:SMI1/KNR4 family protein n=1 Tax=Clostridium sp. OS1-26 TaxID=3070681 RepID=UPI0027E0CF3B|nr:SMI1/KNR4 family protein [Clostridium sp. OS1-26]WML33305.1 hypothetical protein RCG18_18390 [Clostridium sp. OS1-26]